MDRRGSVSDSAARSLLQAAAALAVFGLTSSHRQSDLVGTPSAVESVVPAVHVGRTGSRGRDRQAIWKTAHLRADRLVRRQGE